LLVFIMDLLVVDGAIVLFFDLREVIMERRGRPGALVVLVWFASVVSTAITARGSS
jgi:hypothetical protein